MNEFDENLFRFIYRFNTVQEYNYDMTIKNIQTYIILTYILHYNVLRTSSKLIRSASMAHKYTYVHCLWVYGIVIIPSCWDFDFNLSTVLTCMRQSWFEYHRPMAPVVWDNMVKRVNPGGMKRIALNVFF